MKLSTPILNRLLKDAATGLEVIHVHFKNSKTPEEALEKIGKETGKLAVAIAAVYSIDTAGEIPRKAKKGPSEG